jgi:hypothetical protein
LRRGVRSGQEEKARRVESSTAFLTSTPYSQRPHYYWPRCPERATSLTAPRCPDAAGSQTPLPPNLAMDPEPPARKRRTTPRRTLWAEWGFAPMISGSSPGRPDRSVFASGRMSPPGGLRSGARAAGRPAGGSGCCCRQGSLRRPGRSGGAHELSGAAAERVLHRQCGPLRSIPGIQCPGSGRGVRPGTHNARPELIPGGRPSKSAP